MSNNDSPFDLQNERAYQQWREQKLADYPTSPGQVLVTIGDPRDISGDEQAQLASVLKKSNFVLYQSGVDDIEDKALVRNLGRRFGLENLDANWLSDDDGITSLTVNPEGPRPGYIPYTNRPINWHTDGYYNLPEKQIRGLILHCVRPAASGGANALLDPEIAYIHLRDNNPDYIRALMQDDAMTIPPGTDSEGGSRDDAVGPVFRVMTDGSLHMRYTARKRNVIWKDDPILTEAVEALLAFANSDTPYVIRARLESGMGLISNNILHDREGFEDEVTPGRLLYRARYFDRTVAT